MERERWASSPANFKLRHYPETVQLRERTGHKKGRPKPPSRWPPRQQSAARLEGLLDPTNRPASPKPGGVQRQRGYVQQGLAERRLLGLLPLREIGWHNTTVALRVNRFHSGVARHGHRQRASKRTRKRAARRPSLARRRGQPARPSQAAPLCNSGETLEDFRKADARRGARAPRRRVDVDPV
jgi:hypothetical protein